MNPSFWSVAAARPGAIAVVDHDGRELTAGALLADVNRLSHGLRARGIAEGDAIAYVMKNRAALLEVYLAAMQLGLYVTPISTSLTSGEVAYILRDSGAKAVFCDAGTAALALAACGEAGTPRDACVDVDGARFAELKARSAEPPADRRMGAPLFYTSGTTGRPKGVRRPLRAGPPEAVLASEGYLGLFGITRGGDEVHLVCAPLYHGAAINWCTDHMHLGHTVVLLAKWTPETMLATIAQRRVTAALVVPTHFNRLLALPAAAREAHDVSSLRHVIHTGAPCSIDVKQAMMAWWGPVIYEIYAASEGAATMVSPAEWLARPGTVGKPLPYSRVRVLRDDGTDCAPREPGAVYIRQAGMRFEYHADRTKTEGAHRGAFFTVGDIGYLDEDGYLYLCDRATDVIIAGGVNIYPSEIEHALAAHPSVADAAVIGAPDDEWGEQVRAIVELVPGQAGSPALAEELIAHCRARLAPFKCPRAVDFSERLPRDDNGKLYKRKLRDAAWAGRTRKI